MAKVKAKVKRTPYLDAPEPNAWECSFVPGATTGQAWCFACQTYHGEGDVQLVHKPGRYFEHDFACSGCIRVLGLQPVAD
jgi:hypothetical protein